MKKSESFDQVIFISDVHFGKGGIEKLQIITDYRLERIDTVTILSPTVSTSQALNGLRPAHNATMSKTNR